MLAITLTPAVDWLTHRETILCLRLLTDPHNPALVGQLDRLRCTTSRARRYPPAGFKTCPRCHGTTTSSRGEPGGCYWCLGAGHVPTGRP
jgi:hypothetical protein